MIAFPNLSLPASHHRLRIPGAASNVVAFSGRWVYEASRFVTKLSAEGRAMKEETWLVTEYQRFAEFLWRNEEVGERRVQFLVTLTTAICGGVAGLSAYYGERLPSETLDVVLVGGMCAVFIFGLLTFLRLLQRNRVTDSYKAALDYLRGQAKKLSPGLAELELPLGRTGSRFLRGGLAETTAAANSFTISVIAWIGAERSHRPLLASLAAIVSLALHIALMSILRRRQGSLGQYYRAGVGAVITNGRGEVLACERSDDPGSWQLPQGGMEEAEAPDEALRRELGEETGLALAQLRLLESRSLLLAYDLPPQYRSAKTGRGQVQHWFFLEFSKAELPAISLGREFRAWRWMPIPDLVAGAVDFRRAVYRQIENRLKSLLADEGSK